MINEATLEARLDILLKKIFPTLLRPRISYQETFSLKFGHHHVMVDGFRRASAGARLDILIKIDRKPLAVVELKREEEVLTDDDRDQGISYARLLTPMPPLVIVSNGNNVCFYRTYNKEKWEPVHDSIDEKAVQELFKFAMVSALTEQDEAVRLLLGRQPDIWARIIKDFTNKALEQLEGDISDFTRPISKGFQIKREIVSKLISLLSTGEKLVALVGSPLSGKTNVLYQLCKSEEFHSIIPLYVDVSSTTYGILRLLANQFTNGLFTNTNTNDVRSWLMHGLRNSVNGRLIIIIDGWSVKSKERILEDVQELISLATNSDVSILLAVNSSTFDEISKIDGRSTYTEIGRLAKVVKLDSMDNYEFSNAREYIKQRFSAFFYNGSQYNTEFRFPGLLRILVSNLPAQGDIDSLPQKEGYKGLYAFESVTNINMLKKMWDKFGANYQLRSDITYLVKAYIHERKNRNNDPFLSIISYGKGHVKYSTAEKIIGESRIERLMQQGYIQLVGGKTNSVWVLPRVPMLLSAAASYYISDCFFEIFIEKGFDEAYDYLIYESEYFPFSDLVGTGAIIEISKKNDKLLTDLIDKLIKSPPIKEISRGRKKVLLSISETDAKDIVLNEDEEQIFISNLHPWLILSQIVYLPLGDLKGKRDVHINLLAKLGSYPDLLRRIDIVPMKDMKGFHFHDIEGIGSVLCGKAGIVEPIVSAMQRAFLEIPNEMIKLCEFAKKSNEYFLAWRLYKAACTGFTLTEESASEASKCAVEILNPVINFNKEVYSKIGRNDPCPCGSGKKFKKCHGNKLLVNK